jgi:hypothetical protein
MVAMVERIATPTRMPDYGVFAPVRTQRVPSEYIVLAAGTRVQDRIAAKLRQHGIRVDELRAMTPLKVEQFTVTAVRRAERSFQGHLETSIEGHYEETTVSAPAGSLVVRTNQPLGALAFYLLEPESDDGVTTWNLLEPALTSGAAHPVLKRLP